MTTTVFIRFSTRNLSPCHTALRHKTLKNWGCCFSLRAGWNTRMKNWSYSKEGSNTLRGFLTHWSSWLRKQHSLSTTPNLWHLQVLRWQHNISTSLLIRAHAAQQNTVAKAAAGPGWGQRDLEPCQDACLLQRPHGQSWWCSSSSFPRASSHETGMLRGPVLSANTWTSLPQVLQVCSPPSPQGELTQVYPDTLSDSWKHSKIFQPAWIRKFPVLLVGHIWGFWFLWWNQILRSKSRLQNEIFLTQQCMN